MPHQTIIFQANSDYNRLGRPYLLATLELATSLAWLDQVLPLGLASPCLI